MRQVSFATLMIGSFLLADLCLFGGAARADTFMLRNGKVLEGTAVRDGKILIITTYGGKTSRVPVEQIAVRVPEPARNEYYARAAKLKANDAEGHFALGRWAVKRAASLGPGREKRALEQAGRKEFKLVLKLNPAHAGAGHALGFKLRGERWVPKKAQKQKIATGAQTAKTLPRISRRELLKKLRTPAPEAVGEWLAGPAAAELIMSAKKNPQLFFALLKAPQLPRSARVREPEIRARAAQVLGRAGRREALDPLIESCLSDPSDEVREAAAKALPLLGEPVGLRRLVDIAVNRRYAWQGPRRLACIALRRWGDKEAVERLLSAFSYEVAGGNPLDPKNRLRRPKNGVGTDNPLGLPDNTPQPVSGRNDTWLYPALTALKEVTGVSFDAGEKDVKTWKKWWLLNQDKFVFPK